MEYPRLFENGSGRNLRDHSKLKNTMMTLRMAHRPKPFKQQSTQAYPKIVLWKLQRPHQSLFENFGGYVGIPNKTLEETPNLQHTLESHPGRRFHAGDNISLLTIEIKYQAKTDNCTASKREMAPKSKHTKKCGARGLPRAPAVQNS